MQILIFFILAILLSFFGGGDRFHETARAIGGPPPEEGVEASVPEGALKALMRREEILQGQFDELEREQSSIEREREAIKRAIIRASKRDDTASKVALEKRLREMDTSTGDIDTARERLLAFRQDRERYASFVQQAYEDSTYDSAEGEDTPASVAYHPSESFTKIPARVPGANDGLLSWPILPTEGIAAGFLDPAYQQEFGFKHFAIDVPVEQESKVRSAASGVVERIKDRGLGYSTISIRHSDDLRTVYGHITTFLVQEGQKIAEGQVIGLSGGRPGTPGAGPFSTGPHLHFEVHAYGQPIDPLYYLPETPFTIANAY